MATYSALTKSPGVKVMAGKDVYVTQVVIDANVAGNVLDSTGAVSTAKLAIGDVLSMIDVPANTMLVGANLQVNRAPVGFTGPTLTLNIGSAALTAAITPVDNTDFPMTLGASTAVRAISAASLTVGATSGTATDNGKYTLTLALAQI